MFKTSDWASFLIILFLFLQYYVFKVLSPDTLLFSNNTFIATPSPEKKIAYKTVIAPNDHLTNIWRSLCLVAKI